MAKFIPLPFDLSKYGGFVRVTQGFGGTTSHTGILKNSVDFAVGINNPLVSLGSGYVIFANDNTAAGQLGDGTVSSTSRRLGQMSFR